MTTSQESPQQTTASLLKLLTNNSQILSKASMLTKKGSFKNNELYATKESNTDNTQESCRQQPMQELKPSEAKNVKRKNVIAYRKTASGGLTPFSKTGSSVFTPKSSLNQDSTLSRDQSKYSSLKNTQVDQEGKGQRDPRGLASKRSSFSRMNKKNILDFSAFSAYSEKATKIGRQNNTLTALEDRDNADQNHDSLFGDRLPFASIMRRRSCHCSDCGNISKLEKKHLNLNILPKRAQEKKHAVFLSLRTSVDWTNTPSALKPSTDFTPITRVSRPSVDYSPFMNSPISTPGSKKMLSINVNWEKGTTNNLSKFAANKRSFTMSNDPLNLLTGSKLIEDENEGEEELPPTNILKSTTLKDKGGVSRSSSIDIELIPSDRKPGSLSRLAERLINRGRSLKVPVSKGVSASSLESIEGGDDDSFIQEERGETLCEKGETKKLSRSKTDWKVKNLTALDTRSPALSKSSKFITRTQESPKRQVNYFTKGFGSPKKPPKASTKKKAIIETYTSLSASKTSGSMRRIPGSINSINMKESQSLGLKDVNSAGTLNNPSLFLLSPPKTTKAPTFSFTAISSVRESLPSTTELNFPAISTRGSHTQKLPKKKGSMGNIMKTKPDIFTGERKRKEFTITITAPKTEREVPNTLYHLNLDSNKKGGKGKHKRNAPSLLLPEEELKKVYRQMSGKLPSTSSKSFKEVS